MKAVQQNPEESRCSCNHPLVHFPRAQSFDLMGNSHMFTIQGARAETSHRPQGVPVLLSAHVVTHLGFCANIYPPTPIPVQNVERIPF